MARRAAADVVEQQQPQSPPKRVTRARTRNAEISSAASAAATAGPRATKKSENKKDKDDVGDAETVVKGSKGAKRGRPRTKTSTTEETSARTKGTEAGGKKKTASAKTTGRAKGNRVEDAGAVDECSSDDEVDVVTVRSTTAAARTKAAVSSGSVAGRAQRGVAATGTAATVKKSRVRAEQAQQDDADDDEDELAQLGVSQRGSVRGKAPTTTATATGQRTKQASRAAAKDSVKSAPRRSRKPAAAAEPEPASGTARSMQPSTSSTTTSSMLKSKGAVGGPKKKVTFLDFTEDSDKENLISTPAAPAGASGDQKGKSRTGMLAKPVRPAASSATTRGRKAAPSNNSTVTEPTKEPLSPKKATQVAKSGSSGSSDDAAESDDASGPSGPVRHSSRSPTKASSISSTLTSPAKRVDLDASVQLPVPLQSSEPSHPPEESNEEESSTGRELVSLKDSMIASTPARRPPPSPFKDLMKRESPVKAPLAIAPSSSSPKKTSQEEKSSPLKLSPKKVQLGSSFSQCGAPGDSTGSPVKNKTSLLLTPAKKPTLMPTPMSLRSSMRMQDSPGTDLFADRQEKVQPHPSPGVAPSNTDMTARPEADYPPGQQIGGDFVQDEPLYMEESTLEIPPPEVTQHAQEETSPYPEESPCKNMADLQLNADDPFTVSEVNSAMSTPERRYDIVTADSSVDSMRSFRGIPPPAPSPPVFSATGPSQFSYRDEDGESDAESAMDASPTKRSSVHDGSAAGFFREDSHLSGDDLGFTPLATKLSQWNATSPDKRETRRYQKPGPFSPVKRRDQDSERRPRDSLESRHSQNVRKSLSSRTSLAPATPTLSKFFDDQMAGERRQSMGDDASIFTDTESTYHEDTHDGDISMASPSEPIEAAAGESDGENDFEEMYGDENTVPSNPTITLPTALFEEQENGSTQPLNRNPLPMSVTPVRGGSMHPRTVHTVSKVPLKPDQDGSLKVSRKRCKSLSGAGGLSPSRVSGGTSKTLPSPRKNRSPLKSFELPGVERHSENSTPCLRPDDSDKEATPQSPVRSPSKSPKKQGNEQVLQGAVVFTDVHTSEGADASGIFVELLTQMGARCVKSWGWNPRTSLSPVDGVEPRETMKVGITHVVYKDGGVRTLEKVREANGVVKCVGVGWVLDCERENRWVDEAEYSVDLSMLPRGGQKRRKSMEPRALSNINGSIIKLDSSTSSLNSSRQSGAHQDAAVQELRRLSPTSTGSWRRETMEFADDDHYQEERPTKRQRVGYAPRTPKSTSHRRRQKRRPSMCPTPSPQTPQSSSFQPPSTPGFNFEYPFNFNDCENTTTAPSPTTPFYLAENTKLVQQTCPPKQLRQGLFGASGKKSDNREESGEGGFVMSDGLKARLEAARRRSLVWRPKVGSPLAK